MLHFLFIKKLDVIAICKQLRSALVGNWHAAVLANDWFLQWNC